MTRLLPTQRLLTQGGGAITSVELEVGSLPRPEEVQGACRWLARAGEDWLWQRWAGRCWRLAYAGAPRASLSARRPGL
ncbi:hypothetical protein NDU88_004098 [Pleurodeles waltl]|uniref:Uncharacterized protein n=1 Tax=Pleurodeles waltl TaxID=8319 RepID=A0AAV7T782_PLEWA|nr:hypothetical protein NDU88_004098 [Pleurodeles waltl]